MTVDTAGLEPFWAKVSRDPSGCWLWTGGKTRNGYGLWSDRRTGTRKTWIAHRLSWILANGPIPDGLHVCHTCDVPSCLNPAHLWLGTPLDNARDKMTKGRHRGGIGHGEANSQARLTEAQVREIRHRHACGERQVALAHEFGVHIMTISQAVRRVTWKYLD